MKTINLVTKGFGKAAKKQVSAILKQKMTFKKVFTYGSVDYVLRNEAGEMVARVEEGQGNENAKLIII